MKRVGGRTGGWGSEGGARAGRSTGEAVSHVCRVRPLFTEAGTRAATTRASTLYASGPERRDLRRRRGPWDLDWTQVAVLFRDARGPLGKTGPSGVLEALCPVGGLSKDQMDNRPSFTVARVTAAVSSQDDPFQ